MASRSRLCGPLALICLFNVQRRETVWLFLFLNWLRVLFGKQRARKPVAKTIPRATVLRLGRLTFLLISDRPHDRAD